MATERTYPTALPSARQHQATVERAGGIYVGDAPHPSQPGEALVYLTDPKTRSTSVCVVSTAEPLTEEMVRAKLVETRRRFHSCAICDDGELR